MRRSRVVALIGASAFAISSQLVHADTSLFTTYDDFAGTPRSDGINDPTTGPNSWQGWGDWQAPNGNTGVVTPETHNYAGGETLSFAKTSLAGSGPAVDGVGDTPNDYAATNPDPDYGQYPNGFGGQPGVLGSMSINGYTGGYDIVQTGDFQPGGGGAQFANAIKTGQALAIDFTSPDGGTTLPTGYLTLGFSTYSNATTNLNTGGVNPGATVAAKDSGAYGDAAGAFVVNHGTYFTGYIPYSDPTFNPTYGQFNLVINSSDSGNLTFSNIRTVSATWAVSGNGSWTTNTSPTATSWIGGLPGGVEGGASGASAQFEDIETANANATLDRAWTLGSLVFNTSLYQYNIEPGAGGSLIIDNTVNSAPATINDISGGQASSNYIEYISAPITLNSTTNVTVTRATDTVDITGAMGGTGGLTMSGAGTLQLYNNSTYSGGTTVNSGTLLVSTSGALPQNKPVTVAGGVLELASTIAGFNLSLSTLTITGGKVQLDTNATAGSTGATPPASSVNVTSLAISGNGTLDINNNHLIINYGSGADPIASITAYLKSGFNGGAWNGPGIMSSSANANSGSYGIGYADSSDPGNPAGLASGQIEIMYTLLGDANLDNAVNGTDFAILASNFNKADASGHSGWDEGDFNYDGSVNGSDFAQLASNFNKGASQSADLAALDSFASANGFLADVPEPASAGLLIAGTLGALARRRRKANA